jgi:hypothetical protein
MPSRFLFDERVFDKSYFREMMQRSRARAKKKREEMRRFLARAKSGRFSLIEDPLLESIPGLIQDLNDFVWTHSTHMSALVLDEKDSFCMEDYREHLLSTLGWSERLFSDIAPLIDDNRQDRIWRFITLVFMDSDREVVLTQQGRDLLIRRVYDEAYDQRQGFP